MKTGIIGLPQVGKTSLFRILTKAHLSGQAHSNPREAHIGVAKVPDERLDRLAALYNPKKLTHASVEYVDVGAIGQEALKESAYVGHLRNVDALAHVVRAFDDPSIPHVGPVDPLRDIKNVDFDLMVSDLGQIEKRLERLEKDLKKMRTPDLEKEFDLLKRANAHLGTERPLREMEMTPEDKKRLRGFMFLSEKPILYVLNVGESTELGNDLENVNPYAGFMHAVVQPFATIVMRTLLWMKNTFRVNYGWVLVIFGVVIRLALWPLNQKAMRSSIAMQRLQPELTEIQRKYKDDREKQQQAMMKLYAAHGMSPLSPMLGCLPMLLPTPVLFALYFVFQNTIEFRDVPFLWLPDISLRDPYFIMPVLMGASMFLLSWIGMRGTPPNPQAKMMSYMMPVMFVFFFFNLAAGLNLYYFVQNIAALPQQLLLTRERAKANIPAPKPVGVKT